MSPTSDANPVFDSLKYLEPSDIHPDYSDSKLLSIIADIKQEAQETVQYQQDLKVFKRFMKHGESGVTYREFMELAKRDFNPPDAPRFPHGVVNFLVLDDLVGSSAFKSVGRSALTNLVLKNRHLGINILICSQNLKAIPKSIRTNTSLYVIFRFASMKIICDDLYEEVSNCLTQEQFVELFEYATREPHDSLIIDFSQPKPDRFKMGWGTVLRFS
jgi:hypothetical protein